MEIVITVHKSNYPIIPTIILDCEIDKDCAGARFCDGGICRRNLEILTR